MTEQELIEALADKEHASWARWMDYLLNKTQMQNNDGSVTLPAAYVEALQRQINASYADLTEDEKRSDRDEVAEIMPIIREYAAANTTQEIVLQVDGRELARAVVDKLPGVIRNRTGVRQF